MNLDALNLEALRPVLPLPLAAKLGILVGTALLILVIYYFLFLADLLDQVAAADAKLETQASQIAQKSREVKKLPKLKGELKSMEKSLRISLSMLPPKAQIPELLESVSWKGKEAGLTFMNFKPRAETLKAIYAEVPVDIRLKGNFRQLLAFLRAVGKMPRIIAINSLKITSSKPGVLNVTGLMMTYRFIDKSGSKGGAPATKRTR